MGNKMFRFAGLILLMLCLTGCPGGEDDCYTQDHEATVGGLVQMAPLKSTYTSGEVVTLSLIVPASNSFFDGVPTNLFEATGSNKAEVKLVMLSDKTLFEGNMVSYVKGTFKAGEVNTFLMAYNPSTQNYELEMKISLNRAGNYEIPNGNAVDVITFSGTSNCNRYFLYTNFSGGATGNLLFTVS